MNGKEIFVIVDRGTNDLQGVYSRAYHTEYEFESVEEARNANCHGIHKDKSKYRIAKYRVIYELIDGDAE